MPPVAIEANVAVRITAEGAIAEATAVAVDDLAAVADAGAAELAGGTKRPVDVICRHQNMQRRKAANRAVKIEGATTIADNSTAVTITGARRGRVPADLLLPLKPAKNRFFSLANRWQNTGVSPR
jgi:hypothetical protein